MAKDTSTRNRGYTPPPPGKRRRESLLGFLGFWTFLVLIWSIWNVFQPAPSIWPGLVLVALLALDWFAYQAWRDFDS